MRRKIITSASNTAQSGDLPLRRPSFFLVGAPKAGTTSMNSYLALHPDIFMATKELHYFSGEAFSDICSGTSANSKGGATKKLIGEASVFYLSSKTSAYRIKQFNSDAKILIHVRSPSDFILSYHSALLYGGFESIENIWQALMAETQRRAGINILGRENVHVNVFDDLMRDPGSVYRKKHSPFSSRTTFFLPDLRSKTATKLTAAICWRAF
jgi:hypothetical protein